MTDAERQTLERLLEPLTISARRLERARKYQHAADIYEELARIWRANDVQEMAEHYDRCLTKCRSLLNG